MDYLTLIPSLIALFIAGFNAGIFIIIKFNDLHHVAKSLEELKNAVKEIDKKLDNNAERVSRIEGKCMANHG
jgi:hypothetical protein